MVRPPSIPGVLVVAAYFHAIYLLRNRRSWARKNVDFWKRLTWHSDAVVLVWALTIDAMLILVIISEYLW